MAVLMLILLSQGELDTYDLADMVGEGAFCKARTHHLRGLNHRRLSHRQRQGWSFDPPSIVVAGLQGEGPGNRTGGGDEILRQNGSNVQGAWFCC